MKYCGIKYIFVRITILIIPNHFGINIYMSILQQESGISSIMQRLRPVHALTHTHTGVTSVLTSCCGMWNKSALVYIFCTFIMGFQVPRQRPSFCLQKHPLTWGGNVIICRHFHSALEHKSVIVEVNGSSCVLASSTEKMNMHFWKYQLPGCSADSLALILLESLSWENFA